MRKASTASALLGLSLALAGCAATPLPPPIFLPAGEVVGAGDPTRSLVLTVASAFGNGSLAGRPAEAARAAALVEYLAADSKWGGRWADFRPDVLLQLDDARAELRQTLGVAPGAPPQTVVNSLLLVSDAVRAGAAPSLPAAAFPDGGATLARLNALPDLPRTRAATGLLERDMLRVDQERQFQSGPGGGNGGGRD